MVRGLLRPLPQRALELPPLGEVRGSMAMFEMALFQRAVQCTARRLTSRRYLEQNGMSVGAAYVFAPSGIQIRLNVLAAHGWLVASLTNKGSPFIRGDGGIQRARDLV